jgi:DNA-directed RNA polymerase specialized sigma24 family protein
MRKPGDEVPRRAEMDSSRLAACLRGEEPLGDVGGHDLATFREAFETLEPRYRLFFELDMVEGASPAEIQERLGLSGRDFDRLKREALTSLRDRMRDCL